MHEINGASSFFGGNQQQWPDLVAHAVPCAEAGDSDSGWLLEVTTEAGRLVRTSDVIDAPTDLAESSPEMDLALVRLGFYRVAPWGTPWGECGGAQVAQLFELPTPARPDWSTTEIDTNHFVEFAESAPAGLTLWLHHRHEVDLRADVAKQLKGAVSVQVMRNDKIARGVLTEGRAGIAVQARPAVLGPAGAARLVELLAVAVPIVEEDRANQAARALADQR